MEKSYATVLVIVDADQVEGFKDVLHHNPDVLFTAHTDGVSAEAIAAGAEPANWDS